MEGSRKKQWKPASKAENNDKDKEDSLKSKRNSFKGTPSSSNSYKSKPQGVRKWRIVQRMQQTLSKSQEKENDNKKGSLTRRQSLLFMEAIAKEQQEIINRQGFQLNNNNNNEDPMAQKFINDKRFAPYVQYLKGIPNNSVKQMQMRNMVEEDKLRHEQQKVYRHFYSVPTQAILTVNGESPSLRNSAEDKKSKHHKDSRRSPVEIRKRATSSPNSHANWGRLVALSPKCTDVLLVESTVSIGRKKGTCHPQLLFTDNMNISSVHCTVSLHFVPEQDSYVFWVEDHSSNGTFLNGKLIGKGQKRELFSGDIISLLYPFPASVVKKEEDLLHPVVREFRTPTVHERRSTVVEVDLDKNAEHSDMMKRRHSRLMTHGAHGEHHNPMRYPEDFITLLKVLPLPHTLQNLHAALKNNEESWLNDFVELGGLFQLIDILVLKHKKAKKSKIDEKVAVECARCLVILLNEPIGFDCVQKNPDCLYNIASLVHSDIHLLLRKTLKLLAAICCFSEDAMKSVSVAFERFQQVRSEGTKYGILATILGSNSDVHLLTYCLSLINALVNMPTNIDDRITARNDFIGLGILNTIESLKMAHHYDLDTQINVFIEEMNEDSKIVQQRKQTAELPKPEHTVLDDKTIQEFVGKSVSVGIADSFKTLIESLLNLPEDYFGLKMWLLICQIAKDVQNQAKQTGTPAADVSQSELHDYIQQKKKIDQVLLLWKSSQVPQVAQSLPALIPATETAPSVPMVEGSVPTGSESVPAPPSDVPAPPGAPPPPGPPPPPGLAPPPPPFGLPAQPVKEPKYVPKHKMKQLFWKKVDKVDNSKTIWGKINSDDIELDFSTLEAQFSNEPKKQESDINNDTQPSKHVIHVVDANKARNIGIFLHVTKLSGEIIRNSMLSMNEEILNADVVRQLTHLLPNEEEEKLLLKHEGPIEELSAVDKDILPIVSVPRFRQRLQALVFKSNFQSTLQQLNKDVSLVMASCSELTSNDKLPKVLQIVLAIGNYCNYKPGKGCASAFKLEFLTKLENTRSNDNKSTLLHYIAHDMELSDPSLINFTEEFGFLEAAAKLSSAEIHQTIHKLKDQLEHTQREVELIKPVENDYFKPIMETFITAAFKDIEDLTNKSQQMLAKVKETGIYFAEEQVTSSDELLAVFLNFVLAFKKAASDNKREKELQEKKKIIEQKRQERLKELEAKKKTTNQESLVEEVVTEEGLLAAVGRARILKNKLGVLEGGTLFKSLEGRRNPDSLVAVQ